MPSRQNEKNHDESRYSYWCHTCNQAVLITDVICQNCSESGGNILTENPLSGYYYKCQKCEKTTHIQQVSWECSSCHSTGLSWWDTKQNTPYQPDLKFDIKKNDVTWITGDFKGVFNGYKSTDSNAIRAYKINVNHGTLSNVAIVESPKLSLDIGEPLPIRQYFVTVRVQSGQSINNFEAQVYDFRLHYPEKVTQIESRDHDTISGELSGTAYGYLVKQDNSEVKAVMKPDQGIIDTESNLVDNNTESGPLINEATNQRDCLVCWMIPRVILSIFLLIECSAKVGITFFSVITLTCFFQDYLLNKRIILLSWASLFLFSLVILIASLSGVGFFGYFLDQTHCIDTPLWPVMLTAIALIFSAFLNSCLFRTLITGLFLVNLLLWCQVGNQDCASNTSLLSNNIQNVAQDISQHVNDELTDLDSSLITNASTNSGSQQLISLDQFSENPGLLNNCNNQLFLPSVTLFDFDQDLIDRKSELVLNKLLKAVKKLHDRKIIVTGYTDSIGDDTPEGFNHNIELSERRAQSVAMWLKTHGQIAPEMIEVRGGGSRFPITQIIGQEYLNRRVEIKLACNENNQ